jgi:colanic acid biosynthesis glycosyl transferase WcaI
MRIVILSQFFDPEPMPRGLSLAHGLIAAGHEVEVITGFPNYPGGKIYPGYRVRPIHRETIEGVRITRLALYPSHSQSKFARIANYVSFAASATLYGLFARLKADVIYVYHPPLTVGIAAAIIGWVRRIPFVMDVQDLWPDTLAATGMLTHPRALDFIGRCAAWVYRRAGCVSAQSPGIAARLRERGVPEKKRRIIHNWCDEKQLMPPPNDAPIAPEMKVFADTFTVLCAGNMGKAQAMDAVLDAAAIISKTREDIQIIFVGGGLEITHLTSRVVREVLHNVTFLPARRMHEMPPLFAAANCTLTHLRDDPLFAITIPSRIQAGLYAGRPMIMAVSGDAADIVHAANAGITCQPENARAMATAILEMAAMTYAARESMGNNGRAYYDKYFARNVGVAQLVNAFKVAMETH